MMAKTKVLSLVAAILFLGAMASLTVEDRSRVKLEQTHESLTREFAALQSQNSTLSNQVAHSENIESAFLAQSSELAQLRAKVATLRDSARDFSALQKQNQELRARLPSQPHLSPISFHPTTNTSLSPLTSWTRRMRFLKPSKNI